MDMCTFYSFARRRTRLGDGVRTYERACDITHEYHPLS
jgi:hypothetical protein